jgi:heme/copper-type cytochrome/quinol oxidase subunit 2
MGLSLVVLAGGIYLITRVHTLNADCSSNARPMTGAGVKPDCMNSVSLYFIGFVLVIAAMVVLMLAFMSMKRRDRADRHASAKRATARLSGRGSGPGPYPPSG